MSGVRGIIIREDGDHLIIQATDAEVQRFGAGTQVGISRSVWTQRPETSVLHTPADEITRAHQRLGIGDWVFDATGTPVGTVRDTAIDYGVHRNPAMVMYVARIVWNGDRQ